jgi:hypothetical protein
MIPLLLLLAQLHGCTSKRTAAQHINQRETPVCTHHQLSHVTHHCLLRASASRSVSAIGALKLDAAAAINRSPDSVAADNMPHSSNNQQVLVLTPGALCLLQFVAPALLTVPQPPLPSTRAVSQRLICSSLAGCAHMQDKKQATTTEAINASTKTDTLLKLITLFHCTAIA